MKINTKIRYGLRTVMEIGCPDNADGIHQKDIAIKQEISEKYLDPIIASLKTSGIIRNVAGKKSGYTLNRPASDISVLDVFQSFENGPYIVDCTGRLNFCNRSAKCAAREFWSGLNNIILDYCRNTSIETLVKRCRELNLPADEIAATFAGFALPENECVEANKESTKN